MASFDGRRCLPFLLGVAVLIPCAVTLLVLMTRLLDQLGNAVAVRILDATSFILAMLWSLDLVTLLLVIALLVLESNASEKCPMNDDK